MITALILVPLVGAALVSVARPQQARFFALGYTLLSGLVALTLWRDFDSSVTGLQLIERYEWIPALGAEYLVAVDGLSLLLVLLTALIVPFALLAQPAGRGLCALILFTQAALYGTFTAQNFVLWFLFYEMSLIPAFLLIKLWGGPNRDRAAIKFFLYTFLGSVALLLAFLGIYFARGTFDFATLARMGKAGLFGGDGIWFAFAGIALGLAVKVPLYPFHTWLPDAYEAAPTNVAMILTGLLSKMGVYGFVRLLLPLFPRELQILAPWLLALAVCSIIFSALAAWAQTDLKRMAAYLSINHLGYCLLAIFAIGGSAAPSLVETQAALSGVLLQMFNHGLTAAALFYFIGLLEQRRGGRSLRDFGGLMQRAPLFCGWMSVTMFSSLGLPGLNGFVSEFLIFKGAFALAPAFTAVAALGLLLTAIVLLRAMQALFTGPATAGSAAFLELRRQELLIIVPITLLMLAIGLAPQFLLDLINGTVTQITRLFA